MLEEQHFAEPPAPKRRKLRKGTVSCWECKRRKTRCTFSTPTDTICDGCRSRQTSCISQELPDEAASRRRADRLRNVEPIAQRLVESAEVKVQKQAEREARSRVDLPLPDDRPKHLDEAMRALRAAWPNPHDLDLILSVERNASMLFHGVVCLPYAEFIDTELATPRQLLQVSPDTYPVPMARKLLMFGSLLQGLSIDAMHTLDRAGIDHRALMTRAVDTAHRFVTSNDDLACSIEGIECVMMESMYLNNAGNLRRAWLTNRRAMCQAQMIGLHTNRDLETPRRINPEYMWFRIVVSDRYLSLMLGLPQGSPENVFARPVTLDACSPLERMERLVSVATGLTLQRNSTERTDYTLTRQIDQMLREAAALMPPQWWLMAPDPSASTTGARAFEESIRLTNQLAHRHLLVQLHLPYMLHPKDANNDYSKMTAATASRALVAQFVAFRRKAWAAAFCRGIDFVAFVACTTLCIAHIEARHQHSGVFQSLQHERLSDRGLLERALEILQEMARRGDVVARKISSILQPLLVVEESSEKGSVYHAKAREVEASHEDPEPMLKIEIPYFGTITIEKCSNAAEGAEAHLFVACEPTPHHAVGYEFSETPPANISWQTVPSIDPAVLLQHTHPQTQLFVPGLSADIEDWALQGVDMALFSSLTQNSAP